MFKYTKQYENKIQNNIKR